MQPLIITLSCARDRLAGQDAIRDTWQPAVPRGMAHIFLLGRGNESGAGDEWIVDAPDDYSGHQEKYNKGVARALARGFFPVFLSCIDTYIVPGRLLAALKETEGHDYVGRRCASEHHASGGAGYWLSRPAMEVVAHSVSDADFADRAHSRALFKAGFELFNDQRYDISITKHLSRGTGNYNPQWMIELHAKYMEQAL